MTGRGRGLRIVIIGGSAAGASAGARAARLYPKADIFLFEKGPYVSYGACELPFFISDDIQNLDQLQLLTPDELASQKNIDVHINTEIEAIDRLNQRLNFKKFSRKTGFPYDKLIIASGSSANSLLNEFGPFTNVFQLKNLQNGEAIKTFLVDHKPKSVLIIGGGYIALEIIEAIIKYGPQIDVINIEELPLPGFAKEARHTIREIFNSLGISYQVYAHIEDVAKNSDRITGIRVNNQWINCDMVVEALGVRPNSSLAGQAGIILDQNKAIKVNEWMQTNSSNIFAAGDVTHGFHYLTGKPYYTPLAQMANMMGRSAVGNLFRKNEKIPKTLGTTGLFFNNREWVKTGLTEEEAGSIFSNVSSLTFSTTNKPGIMPEAEKIFWHIVYQKHSRRILGATLWGGSGAALRINTLNLAIKLKLSATELAAGDYLYSPKFSPMLDGFHVLARILDKN